MTGRQLEFFRALQRPFRPDETYTGSKGGRQFTYIKKPAIENRLDEVTTPAGWKTEYRNTERGMTCCLSIRVPTATEDGVEWVVKEDGGGFENMEADDDSAKSGYTNAFRRAASGPWGIGRDIYQEGVPGYLRDIAPSSTPPPGQPAQNPPPNRQAQAPHQGGQRQYTVADLPRNARGAFAWGKTVENHYGVKVVDNMAKEAKRLTGNGMLTGLSDDQLKYVCAKVVEFCKGLNHYQGEFDALNLDGEPQEPMPDFGPPPPMQPPSKKQPDPNDDIPW
jgi:hypothetical protein